ncbi:hypothetical protein CVT24_008370 [Panaeolus cyanescens]|uniref:C2H2-type domain-containing protein n=1 Tax=Panaeolus cyanescens TaxID=181874 RepID=A0A409VC57_9AGAR|nr:hypothetical protein CVT24_008370 [Panaeolus cyanescens]
MPKQVYLTPHRCDTCHSYFKRKGDLTRHVKLHKGIRSYVCEICEKPFSQQSGLKTHLNVHSGEKPYACNFDGCPAVFGDPSSAARHRKETHRRLGAYRCPIPGCGSSIKRRSAFAHHLRKHSLDPDDCDIDSLAPPLLPIVPMPSRDGAKVVFVPGEESQQKTGRRRRRSVLKLPHICPPPINPYAKLPPPPNSADTPPTSASDVDWDVEAKSTYHLQNLDNSQLQSYQDIQDLKQGFEFLDIRDSHESHSYSPSSFFNTPASSSLPMFFHDGVHSETTVHPLEIYAYDTHSIQHSQGHFSLDPASKQSGFYEPTLSKDYPKELGQMLYFPYFDGHASNQVSDSKNQQRSRFQDNQWTSSVSSSSTWVHSA